MAFDSRIPDSPFGLFSLTGGDWLGGILSRFAIRNPVLAVTVVIIAGLVVPFVAYLEGTFSNPELVLDAGHDLGWWNQFILGFPVLIYIAGTYLGAFPQTLQKMTETGVIKATEAEWGEIRRFAEMRLSSNVYRVLGYACGALAALMTFPVLLIANTWYNIADHIAGWFIPLQVFLLYYFMTYLALRIVFIFLILQKLFQFNINIQPFHEDECGGLNALSDLSSKLTIGMFVCGIVVGLGIYSNTTNYGVNALSLNNFTMLGAYIVLASVAYFLPLYATSKNMSEAKSKLIQVIRERYQAMSAARVFDDSSTAASADNSNESLAALKALRAKVRSMQVWPFNMSALVKFAISVLTPFVVILTLAVAGNA